MNHILTWCEIPVTDINRAKAFYSEMLDVSFLDESMGDFEMAIFSANPALVSGALVKGKDYSPSKTGTIAYLNAGDDLIPALDRAVKLGGEVLFPKTAIKDGDCGHFAHVTDSEGNRIGLYSMK